MQRILSGFFVTAILATAGVANATPDSVLTPIGAVTGDNFNAAASVTVTSTGTSGAGAVSMTGDSVSAISGQVLLTDGYNENTAAILGSAAQVNVESGDETLELGLDGVVLESEDAI
ncbi:MAG: hypothetical protein HC932_02870 [Thermales bacterium]|nr:hypothetical protein [Thermales bacterium]